MITHFQDFFVIPFIWKSRSFSYTVDDLICASIVSIDIIIIGTNFSGSEVIFVGAKFVEGGVFGVSVVGP